MKTVFKYMCSLNVHNSHFTVEEIDSERLRNLPHITQLASSAVSDLSPHCGYRAI